MSNLDKQIDEILKALVDFATQTFDDELGLAYSAPVAKLAIKELIANQVREAVKEEKSIRAKLVTKAHKDGIADGLQMALYGVKDGSKEEKFIRHLLYSENIGNKE